MLAWDELWALAFGLPAMYMNYGDSRWQRWAPLFGLLGQAGWMHATLAAEQWLLFCMTFCYTHAWWRGLRKQWRKT